MSKDRGEVADAGADLQDGLPFPDIELIKDIGPKRGLTVVQVAFFVNRDKNIVIDLPGMVRL